MDKYNIVVENPESTVVAEYHSPFKRETAYQTQNCYRKIIFRYWTVTMAPKRIFTCSTSPVFTTTGCRS